MLKEGTNHFVNYSQPLNSTALEDFYETFVDTLKYNF